MMKKTALLVVMLVMSGYPVTAHPHRAQKYHHSNRPAENLGAHSHITCDMVRTYVAQLGLEQARAMAHASGMTASEERRARRCLAERA
jgi:hypothetical protein